ncbi:MAG: hypothetical protein IJD32_00880 [Bacteroidaceae bacterium]|nr:hypothetical protein [Bacteroidaceae bacterium]
MAYKITINDLSVDDYRLINGIFVHKYIADTKLNTPIFRYLPFEYLLSLIKNKTLYVANRSSFTDLTEKGEMLNLKCESTMLVSYRNKKEEKRMNAIIRERRESAYHVCASCWTKDTHTYSNESFLMWKCYSGSQPICRIETTIGDLISSISTKEITDDIILSEMNYVDYKQSKYMGNIQHYLFEKPLAYTGEQEVRLYVMSNKEQVELNVNPSAMLKKILISPFINNEFSKILIEYFNSEFAELKIPIKKSSIIENK